MLRVNATDLQNAFGKYLSLTEKEDIVILKNGRTVARMVRYEEPEYYLLHEEAKEYKTPRRISYEEYQELVDSSDQRYELIDGEVYLLESPSFNHQIVVNEIAGRFYNYFKGKRCRSVTAPFDVRLSGYAAKFEEDPNVVQPDVVVVCDPEKVDGKDKYEGIPTLVVEVLSASTKSKDMVTKLNLYLKSGVLEYWIVDPESNSVFQYSFSQDREVTGLYLIQGNVTIRSTVFQDLEIPVHELFGTFKTQA